MYKPLEKFYYSDHEEYEEEYPKRFNNLSTIRIGLKIHPYSIRKQSRIDEAYELFCVITPELLKLNEQIHRNSRKIIEKIAMLPKTALGFFEISKIIEEVKATNEIEGIRSTKKELAEVYMAVSGKEKKFFAIVNSYKGIREKKLNLINSPEEIRDIYDRLLNGEIKDEDMPDGKIFRAKSVSISDGMEKKHEGDPDEESILKDINDLIRFMNSDEIPVLIKAAVTHYFFEYIHPFYDGNGRLGRYLLSSYLAKKLDVFTGLSVSGSIVKNKNKYGNSFIVVSSPRNRGEITFFVMDLLKLIIESQTEMMRSMDNNIAALDKVYDHLESLKKDGKLVKDEKGILFMMYQDVLFRNYAERISNQEISEAMNISRYLVNKQMNDLEKKGYVKKTEKNLVTYVLSDEMLEIIE